MAVGKNGAVVGGQKRIQIYLSKVLQAQKNLSIPDTIKRVVFRW